MAVAIAREIQQAVVNGKPIPEQLRVFAANENPAEVRLLTVKDETVSVYSAEAADHMEWQPHATLKVAADAAAQIGKSPAHPNDVAVKLFFNDEAQLYTAELGATFIYDGNTLIKVSH